MKQLTVIMDDRVGLLADLSYILGKAKINIDTITVEVHGGKAIINLIVKDGPKAAAILKANSYHVLASEMLVVKIKDEPGELSALSKKLQAEKISISNLYLLVRGDGFCINALTVDKPSKAKKALSPYLVKP